MTIATPDLETLRCTHCGWPVTLDYDGPGTGWSHLYPGSAQGTAECCPGEARKPCGCYVDDIDCPAEHRAYNEKQGWRAL